MHLCMDKFVMADFDLEQGQELVVSRILRHDSSFLNFVLLLERYRGRVRQMVLGRRAILMEHGD